MSRPASLKGSEESFIRYCVRGCATGIAQVTLNRMKESDIQIHLCQINANVSDWTRTETAKTSWQESESGASSILGTRTLAPSVP